MVGGRRGRGSRLAPGMVVLALGLAACGSGSPPGGSAAGATARSTRAGGPGGIGALASLLTGRAGPPTSGPGATAGTPSSVAGLPAATATRTVTDLLTFTTPSKNIGCAIDPHGVRCDIDKRAWQPPPRPAGCELDYGQGVSLGSGRAQFVCAGDTALDPNAFVLAYDTAVRAGDLVCVSTPAYLTCRNVATGHGFSLSKETPPPLS